MIEHKPMKALYDPKLIGYHCQHCGGIFTAACNPSERIAVKNRTGTMPRWTDNKRHERRRKAAQ